MNPIQQTLDSTAERFDKEFKGRPYSTKGMSEETLFFVGVFLWVFMAFFAVKFGYFVINGIW